MKDPNALEGLPLAYAFLKAIGKEVVGRPEGPFAIGMNGDICVSGGDWRCLEMLRWEKETAHLPLDAAAEYRATFGWKGDLIECTIRGITGSGPTYSEAAMRALIAYRNTKDE